MSINELSIYFFPGGGHSHNGENSSLIDTNSYSIFDFNYSTEIGSPDRISRQVNNYEGFKQLIINLVNNSILAPSGLILQPGMVNGNAHIVANSITAAEIRAQTITADKISANTITANEIAANTITANEIATATITANLLSANIVLINQVIASNNFDGTISGNGVITGTGSEGWAITWAGDAVFDSSVIRGAIQANSVVVNEYNYWLADGTFSAGSSSERLLFFNNTLTLTGTVFATAGRIAGWEINGDNLSAGGNFAGAMQLGEFSGSDNTAGVFIEGPFSNGFASDAIMIYNELAIITKNANSAVVAATSMTSRGIQYATLSNERWEFYYDGTDLWAVIDGVFYCLQQCFATSPPPEVTPEVTPDVTPVGVSAPTPGCTSCTGSLNRVEYGFRCDGGYVVETATYYWNAPLCQPDPCTPCTCPASQTEDTGYRICDNLYTCFGPC